MRCDNCNHRQHCIFYRARRQRERNRSTERLIGMFAAGKRLTVAQIASDCCISVNSVPRKIAAVRARLSRTSALSLSYDRALKAYRMLVRGKQFSGHIDGMGGCQGGDWVRIIKMAGAIRNVNVLDSQEIKKYELAKQLEELNKQLPDELQHLFDKKPCEKCGASLPSVPSGYKGRSLKCVRCGHRDMRK